MCSQCGCGGPLPTPMLKWICVPRKCYVKKDCKKNLPNSSRVLVKRQVTTLWLTISPEVRIQDLHAQAWYDVQCGQYYLKNGVLPILYSSVKTRLTSLTTNIFIWADETKYTHNAAVNMQQVILWATKTALSRMQSVSAECNGEVL